MFRDEFLKRQNHSCRPDAALKLFSSRNFLQQELLASINHETFVMMDFHDFLMLQTVDFLCYRFATIAVVLEHQ